jgi:hypothetical protein
LIPRRRRGAAFSWIGTVWLFAHVLAYLRDGVVACGFEQDMRISELLKREFDFYCLEVSEERTVVLACGGGGHGGSNVTSSVETYNIEHGTWQTSVPMSQARCGFGSCIVEGELYVMGGSTKRNIGIVTVGQPGCPAGRYEQPGGPAGRYEQPVGFSRQPGDMSSR